MYDTINAGKSHKGVFMKKQYLVDALIYAIAMVAASLLNLAVSALIVKLVTLLVAPDFFVLAIVRAAVGFLTGAVVLGLVIAYESYKSVSFEPVRIVISVGLASVIHFVVSLLLRFYPFVASGTRYLGGLLEYGTDFAEFLEVSDVALWAYVAAFWILKAAEIIVCVIAGKCGKTARLKNRETIKGYPHTQE